MGEIVENRLLFLFVFNKRKKIPKYYTKQINKLGIKFLNNLVKDKYFLL